MTVEYYGDDGPCVNIQSKEDLFKALDIMHTQIIDNIGEESPLLDILEQAMHRLDS